MAKAAVLSADGRAPVESVRNGVRVLVVGGEAYKIIIALNGYGMDDVSVDSEGSTLRLLPGRQGLAELTIESSGNADVRWSLKTVDRRPGKGNRG